MPQSNLEPKDLNYFEQKLEDFVDSYERHADAAKALKVHPSAITQALQDIRDGKRDVFVRKPKKKKGDFVAISVRYFGKHQRTEEGL